MSRTEAPPQQPRPPASVTLGLRTTPLFLGRAAYLIERNILAYRRAWLVFISGVLEPLLFLFAMGLGLGGMIGEVMGPAGEPVRYVEFVAPALLAASAMNGAVMESTFNIFAKLRFSKIYTAVLASPLEPRDIATGELTWALLRGGIYAASFLIVTGAIGVVTSWWAILALPAALLIGFGFGGVGLMATTFMKSWQDFDLIQMVLMPLFLFSATFYPLEVYPPALQTIAHVSPLFHGVELTRNLMLGTPHWGLLLHAALLFAMGAIGLRIASTRFERQLKR